MLGAVTTKQGILCSNFVLTLVLHTIYIHLSLLSFSTYPFIIPTETITAVITTQKKTLEWPANLRLPIYTVKGVIVIVYYLFISCIEWTEKLVISI